jgi:hypothetical protein
MFDVKIAGPTCVADTRGSGVIRLRILTPLVKPRDAVRQLPDLSPGVRTRIARIRPQCRDGPLVHGLPSYGVLKSLF